jgi:hypothetical protein
MNTEDPVGASGAAIRLAREEARTATTNIVTKFFN